MNEHAKRIADIATDVARAVNQGFGSLGDSVRAALKDNITGLAAIRESLRSSSAVEALRHAKESQENFLGNSHPDIASRSSDISLFGRPRIHEAMISQLDLPPIEETPLGRAALASEESSRQLQEVVGLTGSMAAQIGELTEVIITKVVPELLDKFEGDRRSATHTLQQAERSLFWTKWAIGASIVVTVLMTGWQLWVGKEYKVENDRQQEATETLLRKQLKAAEDLNLGLAEDSKQLREALTKLRVAPQPASGLPPKVARKVAASK